MSNRYLLKYRFKLTLFELFLNLLRLDTVTIFSSELFQQSITLSPIKVSDCNNWSGIALLSVPGKAFCSVLLNRLKAEIDHTVRQEQAGSGVEDHAVNKSSHCEISFSKVRSFERHC